VNIPLAAPAKLNLTLDVGALRADGYHEIDSIVAVLARPADEIRVTPRPGARGVRLICKDATLPKDDRNHAVRAARLFLDHFLPDEAVTIYVSLAKRLPLEAGLGGGSSDAATVLRALNEFYPGRADPAPLRALAAEIGSDVPLFLAGGTLVRVRGRGEIVEPLHGVLPPLYGVLVKPDVGVPTPDAYRFMDELVDRQPSRATPRLMAALREGVDVPALATCLSNDFEAAVLPHFPAVAAAHRTVTEAGALRTILCGSGSAVFGMARDREHARDLVKALVSRVPWVHLAQTADA
jgi:4-diphosphocytidyl-2-C-methyl-D-erythritol kinase